MDDAVAAFLAGRLSIIVASRDAANRPSLMRAVGMRLSARREEVSVLLARSQSTQLLADLAASGYIAVVFSAPSTHRTLQLKGIKARIEAATEEDLARIAPYADNLAAELASVGIDERVARALIAVESADVVAVRFTPTEIYDQTPGPRAGAALPR
ncbi:MAG: pyridoxamine 5'-phosphate oxidase family protein [Burkholderiales bacterium]|nr:pyridoxamine 5'-phosphate oxidase family protein [Burkholderiales bacterium]